ncbi:MAG: metallophosphoesterase [Bacteroidales bacterium]|nr:metallophosphoesterase [Bacteroidales bacterium]MBR4690068.1 metallophosphoesterase [Bacteroidales bacterium]MBR7034478.1 metallophosphoesterase [Bacteroidales bacterium]
MDTMKFLFVIFIFLLILFSPDFYIYETVVKPMVLGGFQWLYWVPQIAVLLLMVAFAFEADQTAKFRHIGFAGFALLCLQLPKIAYTLVALVGRLAALVHIPTAPFTVIGAGLAGIILVTLLYGCFVELYQYDVRKVEIASPNLPQTFDGYKIVHISDIHSGSWNPNGKQMKRMVELVNSQNADVVCFTGDLVTNNHSEIDPFFDLLQQIRATDGVFSVLGNHDYSFLMSSRDTLQRLIEKEQNLGWRLLLNENEKITRGNDSIAIIGVENVGRPPFPHVGDLPKASQGTEGMFRILLSHDPTHWREEVIPNTDIPLTLSGHTHAGQLDLPFLSLSRSMYPEYRGLYTEGEQSLYVNAGLGFTFFPIRIAARPEITVIQLVAK